MKKNKALAIIYLFAIIVPSLAQVSWAVNNTEEFKNGDTMELICTVTGTCCSSARKWNGGPTFSLLMNDGVPSDINKYGEIINFNSFSLLIYNMDRSDFLYNYRCSYGFSTSSTGLLSPPGNARYVPAASEIQKLSSSTVGGLLNFEVNVTTVFPAPSCTATLGSADLTSSMTVTTTDDFPFKFAEISMANVAYTCPGSLNVSCSVGSYSFNVLTLEPCEVTTEGSTEGQGDDGGGLSDGEKAGIGSGVSIGVAALVFGVGGIIMWIKKGTVNIVYVKEGHETYIGDKLVAVGVKWTKDGERIDTNRVKDNRCKVERASTEDEGLYVCTCGKNTKKYLLIVIGTVELFSVNEGDDITFGKDIPINLSPTDARWTQDDVKVESHKFKGTVIKINNAIKKDEGLYVLTFGPNNMQCQYKLTVLKSKDVKETKKKLKKKKKKQENGAAENEVISATVETVDEAQERLQHNERLPPVENPGYIGSSPLAKKTYGTPLPPLTKIPADITND